MAGSERLGRTLVEFCDEGVSASTSGVTSHCLCSLERMSNLFLLSLPPVPPDVRKK